MKKIMAGFSLALLLSVFLNQANADDFKDGVQAYDKGDYATAFDLFSKAAELGLAFSQFNLGLMYDKGQGVAQDDGQAVIWYRKAADNGNTIKPKPRLMPLLENIDSGKTC